MDPVTMKTIGIGLELARDIVALYRESKAQDQDRIVALLDEHTDRLEKGLQQTAKVIIDKLESDKLEELSVRTKNLAMVLKLKKPADVAFQYALTLNESVEYARNRIKEGKQAWIGAWLSGQALFIAALEYSGNSTDDARLALEQAASEMRLVVLDALAPVFFRMPQPPWQDIAAFTRGESIKLLGTVQGATGQPQARSGTFPSAVPITIARGQAHCLKCGLCYAVAGRTSCPGCGRYNSDNATEMYPKVCVPCRRSLSAAVSTCNVCGGALVSASVV